MAFCRRHRECCLGGKSCITNCVCLTILCPNCVITFENLVSMLRSISKLHSHAYYSLIWFRNKTVLIWTSLIRYISNDAKKWPNEKCENDMKKQSNNRLYALDSFALVWYNELETCIDVWYISLLSLNLCLIFLLSNYMKLILRKINEYIS